MPLCRRGRVMRALRELHGFSHGRAPRSRSATTRSVTRVYRSLRWVEVVGVFMGCLLPKSGSLRGDSEPSRSSSGDYTGDPPALYQAGRLERAGAGRAEWAVRRDAAT